MLSPKLPTLKLNPDELHLWFVFPNEIQDVELLSAYEKLMTPEEQAQRQRFHFAKHQHQYLVTRALIRTTLSRYTEIEPGHWRFSKNAYGRPEIIASEGMPSLRFNLSHTDGLVICGIVLKQDVGVDVENIERHGATVDIADRFFSPQEVKDLYAIDEKERRTHFFDYWTLKESYIKARGMGLSLPLEQFTFHISENEPLRISFDPKLQDEPNKWQFWLLKPTQHHKVAISLCQEMKIKYQLTVNKVIPLIGEQPFFCPILKQS
ncbi:4'-phosphopantetheinyl transferase superfamily protein [Candidatus Parabeggiatoa sp. HSG14]|uniref:4'-phosphopantetheinyl transferase family protein n=1 Tax=Candidatus Parabeggiatoa sp. HSG14 TaxID=3055593 RepID=UPI0025A8A8DA|nr:4'-phosphopantetheinyl transferase superfamily protein [Thiotrichales bacterium HSG14]